MPKAKKNLEIKEERIQENSVKNGEETARRCNRCRKTKPLTEFKKRPDGRPCCICIPCRSVYEKYLAKKYSEAAPKDPNPSPNNLVPKMEPKEEEPLETKEEEEVIENPQQNEEMPPVKDPREEIPPVKDPPPGTKNYLPLIFIRDVDRKIPGKLSFFSN